MSQPCLRSRRYLAGTDGGPEQPGHYLDLEVGNEGFGLGWGGSFHLGMSQIFPCTQVWKWKSATFYVRVCVCVCCLRVEEQVAVFLCVVYLFDVGFTHIFIQK